MHPSGNYNRHAPWSIPKGLPDAGESLQEAALRETREETGITPAGPLHSLGWVDYRKSRKRIHAFAAAAAPDAKPRPASWEVDQAEFVSLDEARRRLHPDQVPFVDRLEAWLAEKRDSEAAAGGR